MFKVFITLCTLQIDIADVVVNRKSQNVNINFLHTLAASSSSTRAFISCYIEKKRERKYNEKVFFILMLHALFIAYYNSKLYYKEFEFLLFYKYNLFLIDVFKITKVKQWQMSLLNNREDLNRKNRKIKNQQHFLSFYV